MKKNYVLSFRNLHPSCRVDLKQLRHWVLELLPLMEVSGAELSWLFVESRRMAHYNEKFLGHQGSTDVITFQYAQTVKKDSLFGDVLICMDDAFTQAKLFNTTPQSETLRYIIHSILHLQGFDDLSPVERKLMKKHENKWVKWLEMHVKTETLFKE
ncbi:MAG: rRNA maturation RNase YbeY [Verrucomicrobia bacterium]|nr:rRNA maturation RNase YbeY [Verrucomicrobiota bacterium]